jgi:predicted CoA-substrate-specific enzyme activase
MYFVGVDIGSTMTKIVVMDGGGDIRSRIIGPTGPEHRRLANKVLLEALEQANLSFGEIDYVVATGYGRVNVPFADRQITELTCHARGVASLFPGVKTAIDIGGQDAKGLKIKDGRLVDFVMNDKCAAGTGRFLEVLAETLGLELDDLGGISLESTKKIPISSTCTIFAQQEVIARLSDGLPVEDIVAGVHDALAGRVARMVQRLKVEPDVVLTGGVAKNLGVVKAMKDHLKHDILVPADPLLTGAIGAAILGKELTLRAVAEGKPIERKERHLEEVTFFK